MSKHKNDRMDFLSAVEPFVDFELQASRRMFIDKVIVARCRDELIERLSNSNFQDQINNLIEIISEMKAEMHYLKAAYLEKVRYSEPDFNIAIPKPPETIHPDAIDIDMRGDITGVNWWHTEPTGRWAGPENQSSIQFPALGQGKYRIEISVVSEIDDGIVDDMPVKLNGSVLMLKRSKNGFPCELVGEVDVPPTYRLPFWSLKFEFGKLKTPRENGLPDDRRLAIMLDRIRLIRVVV